MTIRDLREDLGSALSSVLPDGWTLYTSPPASLMGPAIVLAPRSPYREYVTNGVEAVNLNVNFMIPAVHGEGWLDTMDEAIDAVILDILLATGQLRGSPIASVFQTTANGIEYICAQAQVTLT